MTSKLFAAAAALTLSAGLLGPGAALAQHDDHGGGDRGAPAAQGAAGGYQGGTDHGGGYQGGSQGRGGAGGYQGGGGRGGGYQGGGSQGRGGAGGYQGGGGHGGERGYGGSGYGGRGYGYGGVGAGVALGAALGSYAGHPYYCRHHHHWRWNPYAHRYVSWSGGYC